MFLFSWATGKKEENILESLTTALTHFRLSLDEDASKTATASFVDGIIQKILPAYKTAPNPRDSDGKIVAFALITSILTAILSELTFSSAEWFSERTQNIWGKFDYLNRAIQSYTGNFLHEFLLALTTNLTDPDLFKSEMKIDGLRSAAPLLKKDQFQEFLRKLFSVENKAFFYYRKGEVRTYPEETLSDLLRLGRKLFEENFDNIYNTLIADVVLAKDTHANLDDDDSDSDPYSGQNATDWVEVTNDDAVKPPSPGLG